LFFVGQAVGVDVTLAQTGPVQQRRQLLSLVSKLFLLKNDGNKK
jgi:hypothetical protein